MSQQESTPPNQQPPAPPKANGTAKPSPDLRALAERVLQLLKEEARLERERQGRRFRP